MNALSRVLSFLIIPLFFNALPLRAAVVSWDGGGDGTSWSDADNWDGNALPGGGDHVMITSGTPTVRLTADVSVAGITVGGASGTQTLDARGFHLTLGTDSSTIAANGVLMLGDRPFGNSFALTINGPLALHGRMEWSNGALYANTYYEPPAGRLITVAESGTMRWIGGGERYIMVTLENRGTIRWEGGTTYYNQGYTVASSGTFEADLAADASFMRTGVNSLGPWGFTNTGTVRKSGPGAASIQVELKTIGGIVDVREGMLLQNYASRWENATIAVAAGATLQLTANRMHEPHTIAGTLSGDPAGTFLATGIGNGYFTTITADPVMGGVVDIGGTGFQLDDASLGGLYDPVAKIYSAGPINRGLMRFVGLSNKGIDGPFVNRDTLRWESGNLYYSMVATFSNEHMFEITSDSNVSFGTSGVNGIRPGPFVNTGTMLKTGTGTVTSTVDINTVRGSVDIRNGKFLQTTVTLWDDASLSVGAGATLHLGGYLLNHVIAGTLRGDPQGTFVVSALVYSYSTGLIADSARGGRLEIGGTGIQVADIDIGGITGTHRTPVNGGLIRFVGPPAYQSITAPFRNEGRARWESGSISLRPGVTFTNAGLFEIDVDADKRVFGANPAYLINEESGIVRKLDTEQVVLRADVNNRGTFAVREGEIIVENYSNRFVSTATGIISGVGVLNLREIPADRLANDGITAPGPGDRGEGVGTLTVIGPFPHDRYEFELSGPDSALYDRLITAQGSPDISDDSAFVTITGGFTPVLGNRFDVIAGPVVGKLVGLVVSPPEVGLIATYPVNLVRLVLGLGEEDARVTVIAPVVTARQGESVSIPVKVVATAAARGAGATEATFSLRYNVTLLGPVGSTPKGTIGAGERVIDLRLPLSSSSDTTLFPLSFRATLGNDSMTALTVGNAASNGSNVTVTSVDGSFTLLDLCREGGARLLNPDGAAAMSKIRSNPFSDDISFDLNLIERGPTSIMLVDMTGTVVRTLEEADRGPGTHDIHIDVGEIPAGRYFVTVRTQTIVLIGQVEVAR